MTARARVLNCLKAASGPVTDRALVAVMAGKLVDSSKRRHTLRTVIGFLRADGTHIERFRGYGYSVRRRTRMEAAE